MSRLKPRDALPTVYWPRRKSRTHLDCVGQQVARRCRFHRSHQPLCSGSGVLWQHAGSLFGSPLLCYPTGVIGLPCASPTHRFWALLLERHHAVAVRLLLHRSTACYAYKGLQRTCPAPSLSSLTCLVLPAPALYSVVRGARQVPTAAVSGCRAAQCLLAPLTAANVAVIAGQYICWQTAAPVRHKLHPQSRSTTCPMRCRSFLPCGSRLWAVQRAFW